MSTFGQPGSSPGFGSAAITPPRTAPWLAGGAAAVVVVIAAGWFGLVAPQRSAASDLRSTTAQVEANGQALAARVTDLKQEFAALPEHQAKLTALQAQLPGDAALPALVRGLQDVAGRSGVQLTGLTPSAPVPLGGAATSSAQPTAAAAGTAAGGAAGTSSEAASATTSTTGASTSTTGASTSTTGAGGSAAAGSGLLQVPVTITATGSYAALMSFLEGVQQEQRLVLVTGTTVTTGTQSAEQGGLVLSVSGAVFVLPSAAGGSPAGTSTGTGAAVAPAGTTNAN